MFRGVFNSNIWAFNISENTCGCSCCVIVQYAEKCSSSRCSHSLLQRISATAGCWLIGCGDDDDGSFNNVLQNETTALSLVI